MEHAALFFPMEHRILRRDLAGDAGCRGREARDYGWVVDPFTDSNDGYVRILSA